MLAAREKKPSLGEDDKMLGFLVFFFKGAL